MPARGVLADEDVELAVRRCESVLRLLVGAQEGVREVAELRNLEELVEFVEVLDTAALSASAMAFDTSAALRHGIKFC